MHSRPEPLPFELAEALDRTAARRGELGQRIHYFAETGSTNDHAAMLADAGAPQGTVVVASAQTAGRGRLGRTWFSPPGAGLYVSVIVRDRRAAPLLTLAAGVAVAEGIRSATGLRVEIKWPNDVVMRSGVGRARKLAGVLAEACTGPDGVQHVVVGFGINVRAAAYPPEIADRATSLETELGREVEPAPVLAETLAALAGWMSCLTNGDSQALRDRWSALAPSACGALVEWDTAEGTQSGRTAGIDADGALIAQHGSGSERIISGTVRWL